jgi:UDP-N-acetylmuramate dehydrogenase
VSDVTDLPIETDVPLRSLSTLGVGGPARYSVRATDRDMVRQALLWAAERALPVFVLGGGSNVVFADDGFPGLVLRIDLRGLEIQDDAGEVRAAAGEPWDPLVATVVGRELAGLECLSGIPGRVGATPIQNVGAYGQDVSETVTEVEAYDRARDAFVTLSSTDCGFGYRTSRFKETDRERYVLLAVRYRLVPGGAPALRYPELERTLTGHGAARPSLAEVREAVIGIRRRKSMVIDVDDPNRRSVGSFFVNPVVPARVVERIQEQLRGEGDESVATMPVFPAGEDRRKLSAAWLIERAGFGRGYRRGEAGISTNHTLALVNRGAATARDIVELAREVRRGVHERFGVTLTPEPIFVNVSLDGEGPA